MTGFRTFVAGLLLACASAASGQDAPGERTVEIGAAETHQEGPVQIDTTLGSPEFLHEIRFDGTAARDATIDFALRFTALNNLQTDWDAGSFTLVASAAGTDIVDESILALAVNNGLGSKCGSWALMVENGQSFSIRIAARAPVTRVAFEFEMGYEACLCEPCPEPPALPGPPRPPELVLAPTTVIVD